MHKESVVDQESQDPLVVLANLDPKGNLERMAVMVSLEKLEQLESLVHPVHQVHQEHLVCLVTWVSKETREKKDQKEVKETREFLVKGDLLVLLENLVSMDDLENLDCVVSQENLADKDQWVSGEVKDPQDGKDDRVKEDREGFQVHQVFQEPRVMLANKAFKVHLEKQVNQVLQVK